ncbi:MAG: CaiB/BaiF CoA transferase family protein [Eggerthellaceae bacterium]|jgi:crotonobetainyl-CoA:carnitine CoA-transferase CaiB-like acyl-CoA transferase
MKGLEGIKVVELCGYVAAPACPRILAEMGATVYKIEPLSGDEYRTNAPGFGMEKTDIDDPAFDLASMNKTWLAVNLKSPEGKEFVYKLLEDADILVTSFRDKALKKLGFDWETIHAKFPHLVWGQMRGYGERGPERDTKGFDATAYSARGGLFAVIPQAGEHYAPGNVPAAFGDWNASIALAAGLLSALVRKDRCGEGDKVTVNLYHMACWGFQHGIAETQFGDQWPKSRRHVTCPTNDSYHSSDGVWFLICYGSYNLFYNHVMRFIGREDLVDHPIYSKQETMMEQGVDTEVVIDIIEKAFAQKTWAEWEQIFKENDVPYQRINTFHDVLEDEEAYDNDILRPIHYDAFGDKCLTTSPIRMESVGDPVLYRSRPIGYDTAEVMREYGYTDDQIEAMAASGAVGIYDGPELPDSVFAPSFGPDHAQA